MLDTYCRICRLKSICKLFNIKKTLIIHLVVAATVAYECRMLDTQKNNLFVNFENFLPLLTSIVFFCSITCACAEHSVRYRASSFIVECNAVRKSSRCG